MADNTNIHAKPQINVVTEELELSQLAIRGAGPLKDAATLATADWVKIW
jgi:hypothetical protein